MKTTLFNRRTLTSSYLVTASLMLSLSACDSTPNSSSQATDSTKSSASPALAMNQTYTKPEIIIN